MRFIHINQMRKSHEMRIKIVNLKHDIPFEGSLKTSMCE